MAGLLRNAFIDFDQAAAKTFRASSACEDGVRGHLGYRSHYGSKITHMISDTASAPQDSPSEEQVNLAIGKRLRRRRRLLGLTQTDIAKALGIRFQQVQKYECSASRVSAAKLYFLAKVLKVPVSYFFDQLPATTPSSALKQESLGDSIAHLLGEKETLNLLNSYARLPATVRQRLREFASSLGDVGRDRPSLGEAS